MTGKLKYIHSYTDRHGQVRHYFRRRGCPKVALPGTIGSAGFMKAYRDAMAGAPPVTIPARPRKPSAGAIPHGPNVGVYLLLVDGRLSYIGSSMKMPKRVAEHRVNGRPFDKVFYIATTVAERGALERELIAALHPAQNRTHRAKREPILANRRNGEPNLAVNI